MGTGYITPAGRDYLASLDAKVEAATPLAKSIIVENDAASTVKNALAKMKSLDTEIKSIQAELSIQIILDRMTSEQFDRLQEIATINSMGKTGAFVADTSDVDRQLKGFGLIDITSVFGTNEAILTDKGLACFDDDLTGTMDYAPYQSGQDEPDIFDWAIDNINERYPQPTAPVVDAIELTNEQYYTLDSIHVSFTQQPINPVVLQLEALGLVERVGIDYPTLTNAGLLALGVKPKSAPVVSDVAALTLEQRVSLQTIANLEHTDRQAVQYTKIPLKGTRMELFKMGLIELIDGRDATELNIVVTEKGAATLRYDTPVSVASDVATIAANSANGHTLDALLENKPRSTIKADYAMRQLKYLSGGKNMHMNAEDATALLDVINDMFEHIDMWHDLFNKVTNHD